MLIKKNIYVNKKSYIKSCCLNEVLNCVVYKKRAKSLLEIPSEGD